MKINLSLTLVCTFLIASISSAEKLEIESIDSNGQIIFNEISNAANYTVEWASNLEGPWDEFSVIDSVGFGSITSSVAMFYRVIAITNNPILDMVLIPGGTNNGVDPDRGAYSLTVDSFYMANTAVSKEQWDKVSVWAVTNGYSFSREGQAKDPTHPVNTLQGYDCMKWCNAFSEMESRSPCYMDGTNVFRTGGTAEVLEIECDFDLDGYRFPTSDEWEYAARGGVSDTRFPWGDFIWHTNANYFSKDANDFDKSITRGYHPDYNDGEEPYTSPVKSFVANNYGLYGMIGNVWEWCETKTPSGERYLCGGSWDESPVHAACGAKIAYESYYSTLSLGFRVVRQ